MTPIEYVQEFVLPTLLQSKRDRRSRYWAYLSCLVIWHIKDYLESAGETSINERLHEQVGMHFAVVRGVANGAKHERTKRPHEIPFESGSDWFRPPAVAGQLQCGLSRLGDIDGGREFEFASQRHDIYISACSVLLAFTECYPNHLADCDVTSFL